MPKLWETFLSGDDADSLIKCLVTGYKPCDLCGIAYKAIHLGSYECLTVILRHDEFDPYLQFPADGHVLPLLHHAIRLGELHACKLLLDHRVHPLVCSGQCVTAIHANETSSKATTSTSREACEDAVRYALHSASISNRRNAIAVLLQAHLSVTEACDSADSSSLDLLLPARLRLQCAFTTFTSHQASETAADSTTDATASTVGSFIWSSLSTVIEETGSTWSALNTQGLPHQAAVASAVALGSGGMRLGRRWLAATSDCVKQVLSSPFPSMSNTDSGPLVNRSALEMNVLNEEQLTIWTASCLSRLPLICVHRNFSHGLIKLLNLGFRPSLLRLANSSLLSSCDSSAWNSPFASHLHVRGTIVDEAPSSGNNGNMNTIQFWSDGWFHDMDSAIHAAIRFNHVHLLNAILDVDRTACNLSLSDMGGMGALPIHTAAAWGRSDCLLRLLQCGSLESGGGYDTSIRTLSHELLKMPEDDQRDPLRTFSCRLEGSPAFYRFVFCIDQLDMFGLTPFLLAVINGHTDVVRTLLQFPVAMHLTPDQEFLPQTSSQPEQGEEPATLPSNLLVNSQQRHPLSPVDMRRTVSASWFIRATKQKVVPTMQSNCLLVGRYFNETTMGEGLNRVVCGQFNALHLSIVSGNIAMVELLLDYLGSMVDCPVRPCASHLSQGDRETGELGVVTPLDLAFLMGDLNENVGSQLTELLLNSMSTVQPIVLNSLFTRALKRQHYGLAGLFLSRGGSLTVSESIGDEWILNWSRKPLNRDHVTPALWHLWHGPLTEAVRLAAKCCSMPSERNVFNSITRVVLSNCGLCDMPWCLLHDLPSLRELDLSSNCLNTLPGQLIQPEFTSNLIWAPHLVSLDLSHNQLFTVPEWMFYTSIATPTKTAVSKSRRRSQSLCRTIHCPPKFAPQLTNLILANNLLHHLPQTVWLASRLCLLDVSSNQLVQLPPAPELSKQSWRGHESDTQDPWNVQNDHSNKPSVLFDAPHRPNDGIQKVIIQPLSGGDIPDPSEPNDLTTTSGLIFLWLQHNRLTNLLPGATNYTRSTHPRHQPPTHLAQLTPRLRHLDVSHNRLRQLPSTNQLPPTLTHLDLSYNAITDWPAMALEDSKQQQQQPRRRQFGNGLIEFGSLMDLATLSSPHWRTRHRSVSRRMWNSRSTRVFNKNLETRRESMSVPRSKHPALVEELRGRALETDGIINFAALPYLEHLNLRGNRLQEFPPHSLTTELLDEPIRMSVTNDATQDSLLAVQEKFPQRLKTLDLGDNRDLRELRDTVCDWSGLRQIFLDGCLHLEQLPLDLWRLSDLHALYLEHTPLELDQSVPPTSAPPVPTGDGSSTRMSWSTRLSITPPSRSGETQTMLKHLRTVSIQPRPHTHVRLLVFGPPGVGKSAVVRLLHSVEEKGDNMDLLRMLHTKVKNKSRGREPLPEDRRIKFGQMTSVTFSDGVGASPVVRVSQLVIRRSFKPTENILQPVIRKPPDPLSWTEAVTFHVWDIGPGTVLTASPQNEPPLQLPPETEIAMEQTLFVPSTVYLLVWDSASGMAGLDRITPWLMRIQSQTPMSPVILLDTHVNDLIHMVPAKSHEARVSTNQLNEAAAPSRGAQTVRARFSSTADLASFGLSQPFGQMSLDLTPPFTDTQSTELAKQLSQLAELIHRAANGIILSNRIASAILPETNFSTGQSLRLLSLPVPNFYHQAMNCTRQMTAEFHHALKPPILKTDQFLRQLHQQLRAQSPPAPFAIPSLPRSNSQISHLSRVEGKLRSRGFESPREARAVLRYMHEMGVVIHSNDPTLRDYVFLSPAWMLQSLLRLFTSLHRQRPASTAVVRRSEWIPSFQLPTGSCVMVRETREKQGDQRTRRLNTAIISELELVRLVDQNVFDRKRDASSYAAPVISLLCHLNLALRLADTRLLLPPLLSARSVRNQQTVTCVADGHQIDPKPSTSVIRMDLTNTLPPEPSVDRLQLPFKTESGRSRSANQLCVPQINSGHSSCTVHRISLQNQAADAKPSSYRWTVHTVASEEIVRLYSMTYIPPGFWPRLTSRLLNDPGLEDICRQIYPADHLTTGLPQPSEESQYDSSYHPSAPPEWTVWNRGMRLSTGNGQIGLARLQQITRCDSALIRKHWLRDTASNSNKQSDRRKSRSKSTPRPSLHAQLSDEWEEVAAIAGQEVLTDSALDDADSRSGCYDTQPSSNQRSHGEDPYRSGVVGVARNTYNNRSVQLLTWCPTAVDENELASTPTLPTANQINVDVTQPTVADFKIRFDGRFVIEDYVGFQAMCLIELYIPSHTLIWQPIVQTNHKNSATTTSTQLPNLSISAPNLREIESTSPLELKPNGEAIAKLLARLVDHMDRLLEDWYPDCGARLRQSNDGTYLVDRIIPCAVCLSSVSTAPPPPLNVEPLPKRKIKKRLRHRTADEVTDLNGYATDSGCAFETSMVYVDDQAVDLLATSHVADKSLQHTRLSQQRSFSSDQLNRVDGNSLVVGLSHTQHHLTVQQLQDTHAISLPRSAKRWQTARSQSAGAYVDLEPSPSSNVYAIRVTDYLHWLITSGTYWTNQGGMLNEKPTSAPSPGKPLSCPRHGDVAFQAPDLNFEDISHSMRLAPNDVQLIQFLGRGAFGSVFAGLLNAERLLKITTPTTTPSSKSFTVATKLSTPIPPDLDRPNHSLATTGTRGAQDARKETHLRDALALYRQEQRRWLHQPLEACVTAYLETRTELMVLQQLHQPCGTRKFQPIKLRSSSRRKRMTNTATNYSRQTAIGRIRKRGHLLQPPSPSTRTSSTQSYVNGSNPTTSVQGGSSDTGLLSQPSSSAGSRFVLHCLGLMAPSPLGLVLPHVPNGSLADYVERLRVRDETMKTALEHPVHPLTMMLLIHQSSIALAHLHSLYIVHRDVKTENLLVYRLPDFHNHSDDVPDRKVDPRDVHIVLTDFGASQRRSPADGCRGYVGTAGYMAPEILRSLGEETYTDKIDIYSLGIILCELVKCKPAYTPCSSIRFKMTQQVLTGVRPRISDRQMYRSPMHVINLMSACWANNPLQRPTARAIATLTSPWWSDVSRSTVSLQRTAHFDDEDERISHGVLDPITLNGFAHIQSVHRICAIDVVTCAVVDPQTNHIWIGGYGTSTTSTHVSKKKRGLLLRSTTSLWGDTKEFQSVRLIEQWPLVERTTSSHCGSINRDLLDWPQRLTCTPLTFSTESTTAHNQPGYVINCLTRRGWLLVYSSQGRLARVRLRLDLPLNSEIQLPQTRWVCVSFLHFANSPTPNGCQYRLLIALHGGPVLLLLLSFIRSTSGESVTRIKIDQLFSTWMLLTPSIATGLCVNHCDSPHLWFGHHGGYLSCYSWDQVPITSRSSRGAHVDHTTLDVIPVAERRLGLCKMDQWPASRRISSDLERCAVLVSALVVAESTTTETAAKRTEKVVWSYLVPSHELTSWSMFGRSRLRTILLSDCLPPLPSGLNVHHTDFLNNVQCMRWMHPSSLLLTNGRGHLIHIRTDLPTHGNSTAAMMHVFPLHGNLTAPEECSLILHPSNNTLTDLPYHISNVFLTLHRGYQDSVSPLIQTHSDSNRLEGGVAERDEQFYLVSLFADQFLSPT